MMIIAILIKHLTIFVRTRKSKKKKCLQHAFEIINLATCIRFSINRVWKKLIPANWEPVQKTETLSEKILTKQKTEEEAPKKSSGVIFTITESP
ncbi:hypothetical protein CDAR_206291 [Caerostris darwini]|uniref:Uncharacterized protein n=1 Tax=Caerostris darwini TaxID=1538125 RepID=A0AAV4RLH2_9ARAC|nr:hypothetical protein CDAR_206291 [Caerostris darwini]